MLTRYDLDAYDKPIITEDSDGEFVRFKDHQRTIEEIASKIDEVWREKGGINCTEVCAIVRAYGDRS